MDTAVAVVTGAGSGIGAATARRLAATGHRVVLTGRRKDRLEAVAAQITEAGGQCSVHPLDVTDQQAVRAFADCLERVDVLVNNAGGALGTEYVAVADPADWSAMFEVNVLGALHVTQALLPALVTGGGTVVVLSSTAGHVTRAAADTRRPSTERTRSRPHCGWNCAASPCASSRSHPVWCAPRSSPSTGCGATPTRRPACTGASNSP